LHRVRANCDVENTPAWKTLERIGFRREAHFVENLWFRDRWSSEYWYALLDREWRMR
jgi:RimJ/RimL family protein N-acetyltransferase